MLSQLRTAVVRAGTPSLRSTIARGNSRALFCKIIFSGLFIPCFPSPSIPAPSSVDDYDWEKRRGKLFFDFTLSFQICHFHISLSFRLGRQIGLKKYEKIWTPEAVEEACRKNALLTWMPSGMRMGSMIHISGGGISENIIGASGCYFYTSTGDKVLDMSSSGLHWAFILYSFSNIIVQLCVSMEATPPHPEWPRPSPFACNFCYFDTSFSKAR